MEKEKEQREKQLIYLMGSLRNENIPVMANKIRELGVDVFDDWFSPGPEADDYWRNYEKIRGSSYKEALNNWAGKHVFEFDKYHIDRSDMVVLYMPAGKSAHLELGYSIGQGKTCFVLFDEEPERWDVMYQFAYLNGGDICFSIDDLKLALSKHIINPNHFFQQSLTGIEQELTKK